jgi:hypothetical protein
MKVVEFLDGFHDILFYYVLTLLEEYPGESIGAGAGRGALSEGIFFITIWNFLHCGRLIDALQVNISKVYTFSIEVKICSWSPTHIGLEMVVNDLLLLVVSGDPSIIVFEVMNVIFSFLSH